MNENKLKEMMKIYTVSKQVNKKAEKNFIKFSNQYYKTHKADITPELLSEINQLRTQIKAEKYNYSKETSPYRSPRSTSIKPFIFHNHTNSDSHHLENKGQKIGSIYSEQQRQDIYLLYNEEINDLKQQLYQANLKLENERKLNEQKLQELTNSLNQERQINQQLKNEIRDLKKIQKSRQLTEISNLSNKEFLDESAIIKQKGDQLIGLNKEKSRELFRSEVEKALDKYKQKKESKI